MEVTTVGIDLAKKVFQLHGCDATGKAVLRKQVGRRRLLGLVVNLPLRDGGVRGCALLGA
jgi:transposase